MEQPVTPPPSSGSNRPFLVSASPAFSDYYTEGSPSAESSTILVQKQLLQRLESFREQIVNVEPGSKNATLLDAQLDDLEAVLNATETKPTSLEDSGFFLCDEEEEALRAKVESAKESAKLFASRGIGKSAWDLLAHFKAQRDKEIEGLLETVERYGNLCLKFKKRFQEVKHINELVELKMLSTKEQTSHYRATNKLLQAENQALREDLHIVGSELVFLKFQVNAIEQEASSFLPRDDLDVAFNKALKRWKVDWDNINAGYTNKKDARKQEDLEVNQPNGNGHAKSLSEPNMTRPTIDSPATISLVQSPVHVIFSSTPTATTELSQKISLQGNTQQTGPPPVSRWTAFWDALADTAGIVDYGKLFQDDD